MRHAIFPFAFVLVAAGCCSGCQPILGWWAAVLQPQQKVPAVYKPPRGKTVLVLVERPGRLGGYEVLTYELTERIGRKLVRRDIACRTVPYDRVLRLAAATPDFARMPMTAMGRELGADLVLHVCLDEVSLQDEVVAPLWKGRLDARVKLVDVTEGRLWPRDREEGYPVRDVETPGAAATSEPVEVELSKELAEVAAERIVRLFHKHKQDTALPPREP